jgi:hypothetical protein
MGSINNSFQNNDNVIDLYKELPLLPAYINKIKLQVINFSRKLTNINVSLYPDEYSMLPYVGLCNKFLPMFDKDLIDSENNNLIYHTQYDTKNFLKNKPLEAKRKFNNKKLKNEPFVNERSD